MAQLGLVLATFGSAVTADDVPAYLMTFGSGHQGDDMSLLVTEHAATICGVILGRERVVAASAHSPWDPPRSSGALKWNSTLPTASAVASATNPW